MTNDEDNSILTCTLKTHRDNPLFFDCLKNSKQDMERQGFRLVRESLPYEIEEDQVEVELLYWSPTYDAGIIHVTNGVVTGFTDAKGYNIIVDATLSAFIKELMNARWQPDGDLPDDTTSGKCQIKMRRPRTVSHSAT